MCSWWVTQVFAIHSAIKYKSNHSAFFTKRSCTFHSGHPIIHDFPIPIRSQEPCRPDLPALSGPPRTFPPSSTSALKTKVEIQLRDQITRRLRVAAHLLVIHVGSDRSIGPGIGRVMCPGRVRRALSIDPGQGIEEGVLQGTRERDTCHLSSENDFQSIQIAATTAQSQGWMYLSLDVSKLTLGQSKLYPFRLKKCSCVMKMHASTSWEERHLLPHLLNDSFGYRGIS